MNHRQRRLKTIELALTPRQTVLLWIRKATNGTFEDGALHAFPRGVIANSILKNVTNALKLESQELIERAVCQARQEADILYNLAIDVNAEVLTSTIAQDRESAFLAQYLRGITRVNFGSHSEEELRRTILLFVEEVFLLDGTVSEVCAEHFGGQPILFKDSDQRLRKQVGNALSRIENMVSMANLSIPERAIRRQIASAIHAVVQVCRLSDGSRKVMTISEVMGMESDVISMQDIFVFDQQGIDENGRVRGLFRSTGIRPRFAQRLATASVQFV